MNRRPYIRLAAASLAATLLLLAAAPAFAEDVSAQAVPTFTFRGTGYGHGIGMSQYGAQGAALAGKDYKWILGHYYLGTAVGSASAKTIRVNLDPAVGPGDSPYSRSSWRLVAGQAGQSINVNGVTQAAGTHTFTGSGSSIVVTAPSGANATYSGTLTVTATGGSPPLLQVVEGTGIYGFGYAKYRGSLLLAASAGKIKLLNQLPMESYLYGVVPRESPSGWRAEALKAQAVAARSYAQSDTKTEMYCTTSDQAYQGFGGYNSSGVWVGEASSTNNAVNDTAGQFVKYGTTIIRAYFFSQSGGHTANNEDVWGGDPRPYLRGVADSYEYLAKPSYSPWPASKLKTLTGLELANKLRGLAGVPSSPHWVSGMSFERAASGHVQFVTFRFSNGASARIAGSTVRSRLEMLSTAFYASGFPIGRIQGTNRYETAAAISARAYPTTANAVVLASGEAFPDALTGSAVAGTADGPLLLTTNKSLAPAAWAELTRLRPAKVYIMGSVAAVSGATEQAVRALLPTAEIVRIGGANRYETARLAAEFVSTNAGTDTVIVASGTSWPDAAAASALAFARSYPILLTPGDYLGADAAAYLSSAKPTLTLVAGGPPTLVAALDSQIKSATGGATLRRLAGADRYTTAAEIARYCVTQEGFTTDEVYIATGVVFPDSLAGGTLAGTRRKVLLLSQKDFCKPGTAAFLQQYKASTTAIWLFGSSGAISEKGLKSIDDVMMR